MEGDLTRIRPNFWAFQEKHLLTLLQRRDPPLNIRRTAVASSAIARASPQSIAGWRGFAVSFPLQFFRTNPYDVISRSCRRPAATVINFHPATGQTTSGKWRYPNPMFTFRYGYGRARLFELKIQVCRFTWFERRIIDGSLHGTIHNQCHPVIARRETL